MPAYTRQARFSIAADENPTNGRATPGRLVLVALHRTLSPKTSMSTSGAAAPSTV
jgi:hypothetical protein